MRRAIQAFAFIGILIAGWLYFTFAGAIDHVEPVDWPLTWNDTPSEIAAKCAAARSEMSQRVDSIAKSNPKEADWNTTLKFEDVLADITFATRRLMFYNSVSPDKSVRTASQECAKEQGKLSVDLFTRKDLYEVIKQASANAPDTPAEQLLAADYVRSFHLNGLHLDEEGRAQLKAIKKQIIDLRSEYKERLVDWSDPIWVTRSELAGMSPSFIDSLETKDDLFKVSLQYPHYYPFMQNASDAAVRRKLQEKFMSRGGERNKEIFQEMINLRVRKAKLLGFTSHAELKLEDRMAQSPKTVAKFLNSVANRLRLRTEKDVARMVELKQEELKSTDTTTIDPWDWRYYAEKVKKVDYDVDQEVLAEYFPLNRVLTGMFEIYQTLFDVRFIEIVAAPKWHNTVKVYAVKEPGDEDPRAYFYMDLYPRDGKYGHAAAFTLVPGRKNDDGSYQRPVSAMVANFTPPTPESPSLLKHSEVETLFHEFGHVMHHVLTTATYSSQAGSSVKRDFVEAPSQMLENWVWQSESLAKMSGHYQSGDPIPDDMMEKLLDSRLANAGIIYSRQASLAKIDQSYHTRTEESKLDTTAIWQKIQQETMLVGIPKDAYPEASFRHIVIGYDSGYYGYLWSQVYAQDMFSVFEAKGLFDTTTGKRYLDQVLRRGGSREPNELLKNFLGRAPNEAAFLRTLGISQDAE